MVNGHDMILGICSQTDNSREWGNPLKFRHLNVNAPPTLTQNDFNVYNLTLDINYVE